MAISKSQLKKANASNGLYLIILTDPSMAIGKYKDEIIHSSAYSDFMLLPKQEVKEFIRAVKFKFGTRKLNVYAFPDKIPHSINDKNKLIDDYEKDILKINIDRSCQNKVYNKYYVMREADDEF